MIIGMGSDLCNIERIGNSLARYGERFENRVFTDIEIAKARRRPFTIAGTYAKRFAAKEAFSKAVGTGFKRGVFMKDIGVVNAPSGAPTLALTGGAAERRARRRPSTAPGRPGALPADQRGLRRSRDQHDPATRCRCTAGQLPSTIIKPIARNTVRCFSAGSSERSGGR